MLAGRGRRRRSASARQSPRRRRTTAAKTAMASGTRASIAKRQCRSVLSRPMRSASMTCMATFGNGARMFGTPAILSLADPMTGQHGRVVARRGAFFAAVPGGPTLSNSDRRPASTTVPSTGAAISVSVWPGLFCPLITNRPCRLRLERRQGRPTHLPLHKVKSLSAYLKRSD
jgi:hypothetical protein